MAAVAELGSLIWLENVKQASGLLSAIFHLHSGLRHRGFSDAEAGTLDCGFNAEMRESTRARSHWARSYQQVTVRGGVCLILGSRIDLKGRL